jgi:hypothetical protein
MSAHAPSLIGGLLTVILSCSVGAPEKMESALPWEALEAMPVGASAREAELTLSAGADARDVDGERVAAVYRHHHDSWRHVVLGVVVVGVALAPTACERGADARCQTSCGGMIRAVRAGVRGFLRLLWTLPKLEMVEPGPAGADPLTCC